MTIDQLKTCEWLDDDRFDVIAAICRVQDGNPMDPRDIEVIEQLTYMEARFLQVNWEQVARALRISPEKIVAARDS